MIGPFPLEMLGARDFWQGVALEHGWDADPFYLQVWVGSDGHLTDSVAFRGMSVDVILADDVVRADHDDGPRWYMEQRPAHVTYTNVLVRRDATGTLLEEIEYSWTDADWDNAPPAEVWGPYRERGDALDCGVYHEGYV